MSRPKDEYPEAVIELKFKQALRRARIKRIAEKRREDGYMTHPTPPAPIRVMTDEEQAEQ